jgi:fibrillarin-like pre-rRNA processing protein
VKGAHRIPGRRAVPTDHPNLRRTDAPRGPEYYSRGLADPPSVRGERLRDFEGTIFRHWEPSRSKLAAALVIGWSGPLPMPDQRWLYLGAGAGTTAAHVADLVGSSGEVYGVEPSVRPFLRLLEVAERYPNLYPILGDARTPEGYGGSVPLVDGLYADVAQPDQGEIVGANAVAFLRPGGIVLFVVKTASVARNVRPEPLLRRVLERLPADLELGPTLALDPFHRRHYLLAAVRQGGPLREEAPKPAITKARSGFRLAPRRR